MKKLTITMSLLIAFVALFALKVYSDQLTETVIIPYGTNVTVAAGQTEEWGPYPLYPYPHGFIGYQISVTSGTPNFTQTSAYFACQESAQDVAADYMISKTLWNSPYLVGANGNAAFMLTQFTTTAGVSITPFSGSINIDPSNYIKFQIVNSGAVSVTVTDFTMIQY